MDIPFFQENMDKNNYDIKCGKTYEYTEGLGTQCPTVNHYTGCRRWCLNTGSLEIRDLSQTAVTVREKRMTKIKFEKKSMLKNSIF